MITSFFKPKDKVSAGASKSSGNAATSSPPLRTTEQGAKIEEKTGMVETKEEHEPKRAKKTATPMVSPAAAQPVAGKIKAGENQEDLEDQEMEQDGDAVSGSKPAKVLDSLAKAPAAKDEAGTVPAPEKEIEQTTPSQVGLPAVAQQKDPNASDKHIACETEQKSQRLKRKTVICDDDDEEEASDEADADVEMEATDAKDADADTDVQEGAGTKKAMKLKQAPTTGAKAAKAAPSKGVSLSAYSSYDPIAAATWQAGKPV
eukprot:845319-Pleurochrysis_carterae.AAC.2